MIKIGILPTYNENDLRPFLDSFSFVSNYSNKLFQAHALPLGILFPNGKFNEEVLSLYDGFLIPGGNVIRLYHILTIHYAVLKNKPLLGICMGMQAIGLYGLIIQNLKDNKIDVDYNTISNFYNKYMESDYLLEVDNHNKAKKFYNTSVNFSSHDIFLIKNSVLGSIYKYSTLSLPSIHNYVLKDLGDDFIVNATCFDNCIEGIEYKFPGYFILGVQFHVEFEKSNTLFNFFVKECILRKK